MIRSRAALLFAAAYLVAVMSFWIVGADAYLRSVHGIGRFLGFAYFPILLLPAIGRGTIGALPVHSSIWLWWFALQMALGAAAIWMYPHGSRVHSPPNARSASGETARATQRELG